MPFDPSLNANVYSTNDLISLAKIKAFGNHSYVVLQALTRLAEYENLFPKLLKELEKTQLELKYSNETIINDIKVTNPIQEVNIKKF